MRRFLGPIWPVVGPDWNEPLEKFDPEFLRRECYLDHRVQEFFARQQEEDPATLRRRLEALEAALKELRAQRKEAKGGHNASSSGRKGW